MERATYVFLTVTSTPVIDGTLHRSFFLRNQKVELLVLPSSSVVVQVILHALWVRTDVKPLTYLASNRPRAAVLPIYAMGYPKCNSSLAFSFFSWPRLLSSPTDGTESVIDLKETLIPLCSISQSFFHLTLNFPR